MKTAKVVILTNDEAKEALVQFWANVLADREAVVEQLREGKLNVPLHHFDDPNQIAEDYAELCIGEKLLEDDPSLDLVIVQKGEYSYKFAAQREQLPPKHA